MSQDAKSQGLHFQPGAIAEAFLYDRQTAALGQMDLPHCSLLHVIILRDGRARALWRTSGAAVRPLVCRARGWGPRRGADLWRGPSTGSGAGVRTLLGREVRR